MARPSKFTHDRANRILDALRAGNTRETASAFAGVDSASFRRWMNSNADFAVAVRNAEASAEVRNVTTVMQAVAEGDWKAAAWWLSRRRKNDWAERIEQTGSGGEPLVIKVEYAD